MGCKCKCCKRPHGKANTGIMIAAGALFAVGAVALLSRCRTIPKGAHAVEPFNLDRYMGKWYEIVRLDFHFEKDMADVTAEYSKNPDGTVKVVNRGYDVKKNEWEQSEGKAKFAHHADEGKLKVSFFGPFYSGYNVIAIDQEYKNALVVGKNHKYMWLLSRDKKMPENICCEYIAKARSLGYDTSKLVWTKHDI